MRTKASIGIGEAWPVLPPGNLSGRVQACLSRLKPTQARNGLEVRVRVRVWARSLISCSSNPTATGEAKWTPPSPNFPSCAQLDCRRNGGKGCRVWPGRSAEWRRGAPQYRRPRHGCCRSLLRLFTSAGESQKSLWQKSGECCWKRFRPESKKIVRKQIY